MKTMDVIIATLIIIGLIAIIGIIIRAQFVMIRERRQRETLVFWKTCQSMIDLFTEAKEPMNFINISS